MKGVTPCVRIHIRDRVYFFIVKKNKDVLIQNQDILIFLFIGTPRRRRRILRGRILVY